MCPSPVSMSLLGLANLRWMILKGAHVLSEYLLSTQIVLFIGVCSTDSASTGCVQIGLCMREDMADRCWLQ